MSPTRLPNPERALARRYLNGDEAEFVVGDLLEAYEHDRRAGVGRLRARLRLLVQTVASCMAWRRSGGPERHDFATRGRGETMMMGWMSDLRVAARSLTRRPGIALGVTLTLGLGVGATTSIFSVVDAVVLRPLAYENPDRLAAVGTTFPTREWADEEAGLQHLAGISLLNFSDFAARSRSFSALAGIEPTSVLFPDEGNGPELARAARVSNPFFSILGVTPSMGRTFLPDEHAPGAESVVLLSYGAWQRRFGGDPDIVGKSLGSSGAASTIVGVLPRSFTPPESFMRTPPDVWLPLSEDHPRYAERGSRSLYGVGRLVPGVTPEAAREEARAIAADLAAEFPDGNVYPDGTWFGIGVNSLHAETVGTAGRTLNIWVAAAALLLLLAVLNAASLLLVRALDRSRELSVRMALGAGRSRVAGLLLAEAALLSATGAAVGIGLAYLGVDLFVRFAPGDIPRLDGVTVGGRVLAGAVVIALAAGLLAGTLPLMRLRSLGVDSVPGPGSRGVTASGSRLRSGLVAGQLAVAMLLLSGAGLLTNSFARIMSVDPGFDPDDLITLNISLKRPNAPDGEAPWQAWDRALDELRAVPGVVSVAGTTNPPFQSPFWGPRVILPGDPEDLWREGIAGYAITPDYLETAGTRVVSGRGFEVTDDADSAPVVLVNETFVREQMNGGDPLGTTLRHSDGDVSATLRIVGVVEDVVQTSADEGPRSAVYFPYTQSDWPLVQAMVRSPLPPEALIPELRRAVARFSPVVPPQDVRTMRSRMASTRIGPRFQAFLVGSFALVALLLAAAGLYGTLSHSVGRRRRELGVRMALGAARSAVLAMVLRQGLVLAGIGVAMGLVSAWWGTRLLSGLLFGVEPHDPLTLLSVSVVLLGVAVLACLNPARRATAVDPVDVLSAD